MKHLLLTTIAALLLVGCGESQQSALPPEVEPAEPVAVATQPEPPTAKASNLNAVPADKIDWGWRHTPTFPNEAYGPRTDVNPDLIGDNHLFDVWVPDGDGPYPVMIYAHGGGFQTGSKVKAIGGRPALAEDNVVFISLNYTLQQGPTKGIGDGVDAINYIKANHEKYIIDPEIPEREFCRRYNDELHNIYTEDAGHLRHMAECVLPRPGC